VLAPVYIFYGFESAGDIAEETKDAGSRIPKSMRWALIWGGVSSFVLTAALLLAMPKHDPIKATVAGGVPSILSQLSGGMQDFLLLLIIFAFFSAAPPSRGPGAGSPSRMRGMERCPAEAEVACSNHAGRMAQPSG
jgi:amino acid transporter